MPTSREPANLFQDREGGGGGGVDAQDIQDKITMIHWHYLRHGLMFEIRGNSKYLTFNVMHSFLDKNAVNERAPFPRVYASLVASLGDNEK